MTTYVYLDANGQRRGSVTIEQLRDLAKEGIITPKTLLMTDGGFAIRAKELDLQFNTVVPPPADPTPYATEQTATARQLVLSQSHLTGFFDFDFTRFITNSWISFLWRLTVFLTILSAIIWIILGVIMVSNNNPTVGMLLIFVVPIINGVSLLFSRIVFEFIIVVFRIETHLRAIRDKFEDK